MRLQPTPLFYQSVPSVMVRMAFEALASPSRLPQFGTVPDSRGSAGYQIVPKSYLAYGSNDIRGAQFCQHRRGASGTSNRSPGSIPLLIVWLEPLMIGATVVSGN